MAEIWPRYGRDMAGRRAGACRRCCLQLRRPGAPARAERRGEGALLARRKGGARAGRRGVPRRRGPPCRCVARRCVGPGSRQPRLLPEEINRDAELVWRQRGRCLARRQGRAVRALAAALAHAKRLRRLRARHRVSDAEAVERAAEGTGEALGVEGEGAPAERQHRPARGKRAPRPHVVRRRRRAPESRRGGGVCWRVLVCVVVAAAVMVAAGCGVCERERVLGHSAALSPS